MAERGLKLSLSCDGLLGVAGPESFCGRVDLLSRRRDGYGAAGACGDGRLGRHHLGHRIRCPLGPPNLTVALRCPSRCWNLRTSSEPVHPERRRRQCWDAPARSAALAAETWGLFLGAADAGPSFADAGREEA